MQQPRNIAAVADPVRGLMIGVVCGSVTKVWATRSKLRVATRTLQPAVIHRAEEIGRTSAYGGRPAGAAPLGQRGILTPTGRSYCAAVTRISTRSRSARVTPMQARCGGLAMSTHSSQARSMSGLRVMSVM